MYAEYTYGISLQQPFNKLLGNFAWMIHFKRIGFQLFRSCLQRHLETAAESCSVEDSLKKLRDKFRADPDVVSLGPIFSTLGRRITLDSVLHQEARIPPPKQPRLIVGPKPRAQGCCLIISNSYSESSSTESGEALPKRVKIERTDWQIELENAKFTARVQLGLCVSIFP